MLEVGEVETDGRSVLVHTTELKRGGLVVGKEELDELLQLPDLFLVQNERGLYVGWLPSINVVQEKNLVEWWGEEVYLVRRNELLPMEVL